ncbi:hypothetical protein JDV02_010373 [Purpureocillium takamizusanense]|uniref:C2H2-type domain-containing protein n=1 Tax=Purpureocillium takamizusanense TaxID=2060973 RepID=A0A9Q8QRN7_9HYPO|nr:uncharacterized protein JDV02_010373 [Purpureocillium takamizusanense]UNI24640.1 hypothetical protein JDV02_010373 [Purpureocillium takamizusanense]
MAASLRGTLTLNARRPPIGVGSSPDAVIALSAGKCIASFERCKESATVVDAQRQSSIEDQLARFSIWAFNMGVFAKPKLSLDHRLREAIGLRATIVGLLGVLNDLVVQPDLGDPLLQIPDRNQRLAGGDFERLLLEIASELTFLHDLSNTIRQAGRKAQEAKAPKDFVIKDVHGNELEVPLMDAYAGNILDRFPDCSEVIRRRLAKTMVLRRKLILYRRFRYSGNPIKPAEPVTKPTIQPPRDQAPVANPRRPMRDSDPEATTNVNFKVAESIAQSTAMRSATTLAMPAFREAQAPTVVSRSRTVAISSHEPLIFPPPPSKHIRNRYKLFKLKQEEKLEYRLGQITARYTEDPKGEENATEGLKNLLANEQQQNQRELKILWEDCKQSVVEVVCPFCLCILTSADLKQEEVWREHVKNDLDAYVCLFEECDQPDKIWARSEAWLNHMKQHTLRWKCPAKEHRDQHFETQEAFRTHLIEGHRKPYSDAELAMLVDRSRKATGPLFTSCPLCGKTVEKVHGILEQHIAGHLRSLALKSLPPDYDDEDDEDEDGASNQGSFDALSNRNTIRAVTDMGEPLVFEDQGEVGEMRTSEVLASSKHRIVPEPLEFEFDVFSPTYGAETLHRALRQRNEAWTLTSGSADRALVTNYLDGCDTFTGPTSMSRYDAVRDVFTSSTPDFTLPLDAGSQGTTTLPFGPMYTPFPSTLLTMKDTDSTSAMTGMMTSHHGAVDDFMEIVSWTRRHQGRIGYQTINDAPQTNAQSGLVEPWFPTDTNEAWSVVDEEPRDLSAANISNAPRSTPAQPVDLSPFVPHTHGFVIALLTQKAEREPELRELMLRVATKRAGEQEWDEFLDLLGLLILNYYSWSEDEKRGTPTLMPDSTSLAKEDGATATSHAQFGPSTFDAAKLKKPDHLKARCRGCSKCFTSHDELVGHVVAAHQGIVKRYMCRDPATVGLSSSLRCENPLFNCSSCASKKRYTRWLSAGSHLASCHFERRGSGSSKEKSVSKETRGTTNGGSDDMSTDLQVVSELKLWVEEVYVSADGYVLEPIDAAKHGLGRIDPDIMFPTVKWAR